MSIDPKLTDSSGSPITSATVAQANKAPNLIAINVAAQAPFKLNEWDMPLPTIKINHGDWNIPQSGSLSLDLTRSASTQCHNRIFNTNHDLVHSKDQNLSRTWTLLFNTSVKPSRVHIKSLKDALDTFNKGDKTMT